MARLPVFNTHGSYTVPRQASVNVLSVCKVKTKTSTRNPSILMGYLLMNLLLRFPFRVKLSRLTFL